MTARGGSGLAALAGGLAALGHAPFGLWPVALFGLALLAHVVGTAPTPRRAALIAWAGGAAYFAVSLHWIVQPFFVDAARHGWMAPFALLFTATGFALFWGAAGWLSARLAPGPIGWALVLALSEMVRGKVMTGFPWAMPGYIWADTPAIMGASLLGAYGMTALTLLLAALPVALPRKGLAATGAAVLLAAFMYWGWTQQSPVPEIAGVVRIVQPNAPQHEKWDPVKGPVFVERLIEATASPKGDVDLIVWPESALPTWLHLAGPIIDRAARAAEGTPVVFGINRAEGTLRHNSLVLLDGEGRISTTYDKVHLVPFGEFIPLGQVSEFIGLRSFAARDGYGFSPGRQVALLDTPLGSALPMICYEAIFPRHVRRAEGRADYLLQITNDAWFGTFSGPYQHLQQAQFRAAEQGLPLVRSANTGISAVIGPDGRVTGSLDLGETGFLDLPLPAPRPPTLYARTGDSPAAAGLILALAALWFGNFRNTIANRRRTS